MVTFYRSHCDTFDNGDHREKTYVGGIVGGVRFSIPPLQFPIPTAARPRSINPNAWMKPATPTMTVAAM